MKAKVVAITSVLDHSLHHFEALEKIVESGQQSQADFLLWQLAVKKNNRSNPGGTGHHCKAIILLYWRPHFQS